jgi:hypothetical protein
MGRDLQAMERVGVPGSPGGLAYPGALPEMTGHRQLGAVRQLHVDIQLSNDTLKGSSRT